MDGRVIVHNAPDGRALSVATTGDHVRGLSFSPDGSLLAAACKDDRVRIWNVDEKGELSSKGTIMGEMQFMGVFCVAFAPSGQLIAFGTGDRQLYALPVAAIDGEIRSGAYSLFQAKDAVTTFSWSPNSEYVIVGDASGYVSAVEIRRGASTPPWQDAANRIGRRQGAVLSTAYASDARAFVTGGEDCVVNYWDIRTSHANAWRAHRDSVCGLAIHGDANLVASGGSDHVLIVWDVRGRRLVEAEGGIALAWSPRKEGAPLAVAINNREAACAIRLYDASGV
jgi:WD40 repeat protein